MHSSLKVRLGAYSVCALVVSQPSKDELEVADFEKWSSLFQNIGQSFTK